jgi:serine/threonine-protein kinase
MTDMLGKYELKGVLGKGAMGTVYEGFDPIIARRVAIKTVRLPDADDEEAQEELARFKREAQAAGRLTHPNIVAVFDYGETPEIAFIVMEYVDGGTLKGVLDKGERFQVAEAVRVMEGVMAGLQFSHDRGVVHRDIKPANIMLTKGGEVKIADFGIARIESSSMTQAGTMLGTPSYMSPEQFMGQTVDSRTDLYSSGVMLYQLLTGEKPFEGGLTAIMHKVLNTEPPPPSALSVTVTPAMDAVVRKAMAKRPEDRFTTANEFAAALRDALNGKSEGTGKFSLATDDFGDGEATMVAPRRAAGPVAAPAATHAMPLPQASAAAAPAKTGPNLLVLGGGAVLALVVAGGGAFVLLSGHSTPTATQTAQQTTQTTTQTTTPPPPPSPVALTPAQRQAALVSTLGTLPCTFLNATDNGSAATINGIAGAGAPQAALNGALQSLPASLALSNSIQTIDGPYCSALDTVRPYRPLFIPSNLSFALSLAGGKSTLHDGDLITVEELMPGFSGYIETDYFSSDGSVFHMYPTPTDKQAEFAAGQAKELGNPATGGATWQVSAPYGTDLILTIATSQPLFTTARPQDENASDYLPALRVALQNAASAGQSVSVAAQAVVTLPKGQ